MKKYTIENKHQKIIILNLGATIYKWHAFNDNINIVLTNKNYEDYLNPDNGFLSNTIGRVTNRIKDGKFTLNGINYQLEKNFDQKNHGHGGSNGFYNKKFELVKHTKTKLTLKYHSPHLEAGYPGSLTLYVSYELKNNQMTLTYQAKTDSMTIVNLTNHAYFNLSNEQDILNHSINGSMYKSLETDELLVPTGKVLNNKNNILNFKNNNKLSDIVNNKVVYSKSKGLDHYFLFEEDNKSLTLKYKNRQLKIETTYPGLQIYTMQHPIKQQLLNRKYVKYAGVALECSFEPDAINHKNFSSIVLNRDEKYLQSITYTLTE